jgi:hypothetical protein
MESNYISGGGTTISKYVEFDQYENINRIDAYLNSKHLSGPTDSLGRDKPFFNIVVAARNIWYRATDIDRKDIRIKPTNSKNEMASFLATIILQNWMRKEKFGVFLNDWGRNLASYGSAVVKFVEKEGRLIPTNVPWNRLITDVIDFEQNPKIEVLELTEAQLRNNKSYNQDAVRDLIDAEETRRGLDKMSKDHKTGYYRLYEVHGEFSLATLKMAQGKELNDADFDTFVQQMHVVSFVGTAKGRGRSAALQYQDFTLYSGKEAKDPYMITHLIKEDGRAQSVGAVEYLFDAQWMQNHSVKAMKDQLDLASKLIFQTADPSFINQNALLAIENGDILIHELNQPLTQVNNGSHDITSYQNFAAQWRALGQEITSTPDALRGNTQPANTPYSSVALLAQQSSSLFEVMTENKGLHLEDMMRTYVLPHLAKQLDSKEEIAAVLEDYDIKRIDSRYVPQAAVERFNRQTAQKLIEGDVDTLREFDPAIDEGAVQQELGATGNTRFLDPEDISWKEWLKDVDWDSVEVEVTNEQHDKQAVLQTLNTLFQVVMANRGEPLSGDARLIFNKILAATGEVSPIELSQVSTPAPQPQMAPPAPVSTGNPSQMPPQAAEMLAAAAP